MYPANPADLRRVVKFLSDDVAALLQDLDAARERIWRAPPGAQPDLQVLIRALQHKLATLFGERHGWRLSASDFSPGVLARRGTSERTAHPAGGWPRAVADHPFYYRTADRRAVAVAVHLYEAKDRDRNVIRRWAAQHQLRVAFPDDFPSWWVPGGTTLCVYEALVDRPGRAAMDECTRDSRGFEAKGGLA